MRVPCLYSKKVATVVPDDLEDVKRKRLWGHEALKTLADQKSFIRNDKYDKCVTMMNTAKSAKDIQEIVDGMQLFCVKRAWAHGCLETLRKNKLISYEEDLEYVNMINSAESVKQLEGIVGVFQCNQVFV